jgi:hypothetical protein
MLVPAGLFLPTIFIDQAHETYMCPGDKSAYLEVGGTLQPVDGGLCSGWGDLPTISKKVKIWAFVVNGKAPDEIEGQIDSDNLESILNNLGYTLISNVVETEVELHIQLFDSLHFSSYDFDGNGAAACCMTAPAGAISRTPVPR